MNAPAVLPIRRRPPLLLPLALATGLLSGIVRAQGLDVDVTAYGAASGVPLGLAENMHFHANATLTQQLEFEVRAPGGAGRSVGLILGLTQTSTPLPPGTLLTEPSLWFLGQLDAAGAQRFSMALPNAVGATMFAQAIVIDFANPGGLFAFTHGLRIDIVPRTATSTAFDAQRARLLLDLAWHAYEYPAEGGRLGPIVPGRVLPGGFRVVEEIESPPPPDPWFPRVGWPETYLFVAQNSSGDVAVVFRGTDFTSVRDWLTDIVFPQSSGYHGGILLAYLTVHARILQALQRIVRPNTRVYVTGHSLGGGLAQIAALQLEPTLLAAGVQRNDIVLYHFAGPRVLSPTRASELGSSVPHHFAVLNKDDLVTHVPAQNSAGNEFRHVPRVRVLYPRRAMVTETGSSYQAAVLSPLTPGVAAHYQSIYDERIASILPPPQVWLSVSSSGHMRIHWSFPARSQYGFAGDFIALYRDAPDPNNPSGYVINAWQWASSSGSFTTNVAKGRDIYVAYVQQYSPGGEQKILGVGGPYTWPVPSVWLTTSNGWATLNWSTGDPGAHDYVALYNRNPWNAGPNGYLVGQWQWATRGRSWQSLWRGTNGLWIAYIEDDGLLGRRIVRVAGPY